MDRLIGILSILLQRDIESLCRAGIPIATTQGVGGGISILDGYRVDRTVLTAPEMQAILAGLRSLDSVSGTRRYAQLMEKLSAGTGGLVPGGSHLLIDLSSWYKTSLPPKIECIQQAIEQHRSICFTYFSPKGESVRTVEPYYLVFHWSAWYVWGWCGLRQDFRLFKLNRMTELAAGDAFSPHSAPLPDLEPARVFPEKYRVTVLFDPSCRWRLMEEYGADHLTAQPDGRLRFTGGFPDAEGVLGWVLTYGDKTELLEPAELRERLQDILRRTLAQYENEEA